MRMVLAFQGACEQSAWTTFFRWENVKASDAGPQRTYCFRSRLKTLPGETLERASVLSQCPANWSIWSMLVVVNLKEGSGNDVNALSQKHNLLVYLGAPEKSKHNCQNNNFGASK